MEQLVVCAGQHKKTEVISNVQHRMHGHHADLWGWSNGPILTPRHRLTLQIRTLMGQEIKALNENLTQNALIPVPRRLQNLTTNNVVFTGIQLMIINCVQRRMTTWTLQKMMSTRTKQRNVKKNDNRSSYYEDNKCQQNTLRNAVMCFMLCKDSGFFILLFTQPIHNT